MGVPDALKKRLGLKTDEDAAKQTATDSGQDSQIANLSEKVEKVRVWMNETDQLVEKLREEAAMKKDMDMVARQINTTLEEIKKKQEKIIDICGDLQDRVATLEQRSGGEVKAAEKNVKKDEKIEKNVKKTLFGRSTENSKFSFDRTL